VLVRDVIGTRVDVAELLTAMLAIPSVSGDEAPLATMLVPRLSDAGFDAHVDPVGNVVAAWGDGAETVALVGHIDTVAGNIDVRCDGDTLHGRGAVDAKGPLAAAIAAVSRQPRNGPRFPILCNIGLPHSGQNFAPCVRAPQLGHAAAASDVRSMPAVRSCCCTFCFI